MTPAAADGPPTVAGPAPVIGILAVQGDVREHARSLELAGARARPVRRPEELVGLAGLIVPGGESTTIDRLSRLFGVHEPLRRLIADGLPVYGSCAGMIQLADEVLDGHPEQQTFGGIDMTVRRNAFGRQVDSFEADLPVEGIDDPGRPFRAVFIRAPWVERLGAAVEVLARADGHPVAVRQGNLLATSFHPEITHDHRIHDLFVRMVRARTSQRRPDPSAAGSQDRSGAGSQDRSGVAESGGWVRAVAGR